MSEAPGLDADDAHTVEEVIPAEDVQGPGEAHAPEGSGRRMGTRTATGARKGGVMLERPPSPEPEPSKRAPRAPRISKAIPRGGRGGGGRGGAVTSKAASRVDKKQQQQQQQNLAAWAGSGGDEPMEYDGHIMWDGGMDGQGGQGEGSFGYSQQYSSQGHGHGHEQYAQQGYGGAPYGHPHAYAVYPASAGGEGAYDEQSHAYGESGGGDMGANMHSEGGEHYGQYEGYGDGGGFEGYAGHPGQGGLESGGYMVQNADGTRPEVTGRGAAPAGKGKARARPGLKGKSGKASPGTGTAVQTSRGVGAAGGGVFKRLVIAPRKPTTGQGGRTSFAKGGVQGPPLPEYMVGELGSVQCDPLAGGSSLLEVGTLIDDAEGLLAAMSRAQPGSGESILTVRPVVDLGVLIGKDVAPSSKPSDATWQECVQRELESEANVVGGGGGVVGGSAPLRTLYSAQGGPQSPPQGQRGGAGVGVTPPQLFSPGSMALLAGEYARLQARGGSPSRVPAPHHALHTGPPSALAFTGRQPADHLSSILAGGGITLLASALVQAVHVDVNAQWTGSAYASRQAAPGAPLPIAGPFSFGPLLHSSARVSLHEYAAPGPLYTAMSEGEERSVLSTVLSWLTAVTEALDASEEGMTADEAVGSRGASGSHAHVPGIDGPGSPPPVMPTSQASAEQLAMLAEARARVQYAALRGDVTEAQRVQVIQAGFSARLQAIQREQLAAEAGLEAALDAGSISAVMHALRVKSVRAMSSAAVARLQSGVRWDMINLIRKLPAAGSRGGTGTIVNLTPSEQGAGGGALQSSAAGKGRGPDPYESALEKEVATAATAGAGMGISTAQASPSRAPAAAAAMTQTYVSSLVQSILNQRQAGPGAGKGGLVGVAGGAPITTASAGAGVGAGKGTMLSQQQQQILQQHIYQRLVAGKAPPLVPTGTTGTGLGTGAGGTSNPAIPALLQAMASQQAMSASGSGKSAALLQAALAAVAAAAKQQQAGSGTDPAALPRPAAAGSPDHATVSIDTPTGVVQVNVPLPPASASAPAGSTTPSQTHGRAHLTADTPTAPHSAGGAAEALNAASGLFTPPPVTGPAAKRARLDEGEAHGIAAPALQASSPTLASTPATTAAATAMALARIVMEGASGTGSPGTGAVQARAARLARRAESLAADASQGAALAAETGSEGSGARVGAEVAMSQRSSLDAASGPQRLMSSVRIRGKGVSLAKHE